MSEEFKKVEEKTGSDLLPEKEEAEHLGYTSQIFDDIPSENDSVLLEDTVQGVIQQEDGVIAWEVDGMYKEDSDELRPRHLLLLNPPVFKVSGGNGDEVTFVLTKSLTEQLYSTFNTLHHHYHGVSVNNNDMSFKERLKENIVPLAAFTLLAAVVILSRFI